MAIGKFGEVKNIVSLFLTTEVYESVCPF
jgi:hypothetical protein